MALLTVRQLRTEITRDQAVQTLVDLLNQLGFSASSWQAGSVQLIFLHLFAYVYAWVSTVIVSLVTFGFNDLAEGEALTYRSKSHYDNQRIEAVAAQHTCELTCAAGSGPYSIAASDLVVSDGSVTFRNTDAGTLLSGSTLDLTFEAEDAGTGGNAAINTITTMVTTLAGVTVNNPDLGAGTGSMIVVGSNAETDASLRERNSTKWATRSFEVPADGYTYWAKTAVTNCRVQLDDSNPGGPGTIWVFIATEIGVAGAGDVSAVQTALEARVPGAIITTYAAAGDVVSFAGVVYHQGNAATVQTAVEAALTAYVNSAPIGGFDYSPGPSNMLPVSEIVSMIESVAGVATVSLTAPTANVPVSDFDVAIVDASSFTGLSYTAVS